MVDYTLWSQDLPTHHDIISYKNAFNLCPTQMKANKNIGHIYNSYKRKKVMLFAAAQVKVDTIILLFYLKKKLFFILYINPNSNCLPSSHSLNLLPFPPSTLQWN